MQSSSRFRRLVWTAVLGAALVSSASAEAVTTFRVPIKNLKPAIAVSLSVSALDFGSVPLNATSPAQTVQLSNTGGMNVGIAVVQATGNFAQTNNCGSTLAPGDSCTASVTFSPTAMGAVAPQTLTFSTGAGPEVVTLNGTGLVTSDNTSVGSLAFGNQQVGQTSGTKSVQLTNSGNTAVSITEVRFSGPYAVSHNCPASLSIGASCTANVTFTPTAAGSQPGALTFATNGGTQTVSLSGTGMQVLLSAAPTSVAFGNIKAGQSTNQSFTLSNTGNESASALAINAPAGFTQSNNCGTSLAANGTCSVTVGFTPATSTSYSGNVTVSGGGASLSVPVSGTGVCAAGSQAFTASGTFTPIAGCSTYLVLAVGGGGSGATIYGTGGGAGYVSVQYATGLTAAVAVTVGTGGAVDVGDGNGPHAGTQSCFGSICAAGGYPGTSDGSGIGGNGGSGGGGTATLPTGYGGTLGGNSTDGSGKGQGNYAPYIALFKANSVTGGAGGWGGTNGSNRSQAGGGGGILFNNAGQGGGNDENYGVGGGTGWGGGGAGATQYGSCGRRGCSYAVSGVGGAGFVYVEWTQ